jgi:hypothetical protein
MLGRDHYDKDYIDTCRARIGAQVSAYRNVVAASNGDARLGAAIDEFEPLFFNNMVLVLDNLFVHRLRKLEGKDGNPLNEVRVLAGSLMTGDGVLAADNSIKLGPDKSVLGYEVGDEISLSEDDFVRLSDGFFAEIESRYSG